MLISEPVSMCTLRMNMCYVKYHWFILFVNFFNERFCQSKIKIDKTKEITIANNHRNFTPKIRPAVFNGNGLF